jgi:multiple sugar transport system ATP-binding protein
MSQIQLRKVRKSFANVAILNDVDLTIAPGEFCVFIGPSGCGKSTLLRLIAGLDDVSGGEIVIDGQVVNELPPAQRNVAMVFQSYALYPHMSVHENMAFGLRHHKLPEAEIERRVAEAAGMLKLEALLERKPRQLSGGQRQRVAIGRAIVRQPKVFLFDEPLSNLDAALRINTRVEIARLHRKLGNVSMVYVTHDQVEAMTLADKIVLLRPDAAAKGLLSVAQIGRPLDLYHRPQNRFVAGFIGSPAMNFLPAVAVSGDAARLGWRLPSGLAGSAAVDASRVAAGSDLTLGVRPEHVQLGQGDGRGQITHLEHLGEFSYAYVTWHDAEPPLLAKVTDESLKLGDTVSFELPATQLHAFVPGGEALARTAVH